MTTEGLQAAYPLPPLFYKRYTPQAVSSDESEPSPFDITPPEPPSDEQPLIVFGVPLSMKAELPSLSSLGIQQLYPDSTDSSKAILKSFNKSVLHNFLELLEILSTDATQAPSKVEHLRLLLINFHHLLNQYRPHQARDTLVAMLESQIQKRRELTVRIQERIHEAKASITMFCEIASEP